MVPVITSSNEVPTYDRHINVSSLKKIRNNRLSKINYTKRLESV